MLKTEFSTDNKKYYNVRGHCHYNQKDRGAGAHNVCNLRYKTPK